MPELPEVKTIRRIVGPQLVGRTIESVEIGSPVVTAYPEAPLFAALVTERTMRGVGRRGKYLVIELGGWRQRRQSPAHDGSAAFAPAASGRSLRRLIADIRSLSVPQRASPRTMTVHGQIPTIREFESLSQYILNDSATIHSTEVNE